MTFNITQYSPKMQVVTFIFCTVLKLFSTKHAHNIYPWTYQSEERTENAENAAYLLLKLDVFI